MNALSNQDSLFLDVMSFRHRFAVRCFSVARSFRRATTGAKPFARSFVCSCVVPFTIQIAIEVKASRTRTRDIEISQWRAMHFGARPDPSVEPLSANEQRQATTVTNSNGEGNFHRIETLLLILVGKVRNEKYSLSVHRSRELHSVERFRVNCYSHAHRGWDSV